MTKIKGKNKTGRGEQRSKSSRRIEKSESGGTVRTRERDREGERERGKRELRRGVVELWTRNRVISFVAYGWLSSLPPYIKYVSH